MRIHVLVGTDDTAFADAVFAACERAAEPLGIDLGLSQLSGQAFAVEADGDTPLILTPVPGTADATAIAALPAFTVEVQPENIAAGGGPVAGTNAQIYGLGMGGYAAALRLIAERVA
ncbi:hypothetical protein [Algicella marina]|uniref:Uncharacterized protein n=1 Tax=Algicella marina TaxID=2683284 RepID=A0A6P1STG7_9RHOB|nr:hypothetical protein [Algicella marina]QHQ33974.1 hypothetical protein GO499_01640 [Algicella marina]